MSGIRFTTERQWTTHHIAGTRIIRGDGKMFGWVAGEIAEADAFEAMVASHDGVCDALEEILNYDGGADNALEDEYVMERAHDILARARPEGDAASATPADAEGDG